MGLGGALHGSSLGGALHGTGIHKFDTGLFQPQRTAIREAIVNRLAELLMTNGRYLRAVKMLPRPYRGQGDEEGSDMLANALLGQAPAVAVALGRKVHEAADLEALNTVGNLTVAIYVISQHQRELVEGRLATDVVGAGDIEADPGIEAMLEHVEELLLGQELGIKGVLEMRAVAEDEVITRDNATVWEQEYSIKVERKINPRRASTAIVTSIQGDNKLDGIPADSPHTPVVRTIAELEEG